MMISKFKTLTRYLILITFAGAIVACSSSPETDGDSEDEARKEVQSKLSAEEKIELKQKQDAVGGSHSLLGKLYKEKRNKELLKEASKILSKSPNDLKALSVLGMYHLRLNQLGAARIFFEKALKKHPDEAGLYNNIGVIQLKEENLLSAYASFKKAYDVDRSNPIVQANLASIHVKYMDYVEAEPLVEDAYSRMRNNDIVANNYAIVLRTQGQYEEAEKVYTKALGRNSRNISTNLNYAILLIDYMKKYQKAQQIVNKIEFLNPTDRYVLRKVQELQRKVSTAK